MSDQPRTRDLRKVVEALQIVEDEFRFQVARLKEKLAVEKEKKGDENEYLTRLCKQYDDATGATYTLRRYHEGRIDKSSARPETQFDQHVNGGGIATAYTDEHE